MAIAEDSGNGLDGGAHEGGNVYKFQVEGQGFSISKFSRERRIKLLQEGPINAANDPYHTLLNSFPCASEVSDQEMVEMYGKFCDGYFAFTVVTGELSFDGGKNVNGFRNFIDVTPTVFFSGTPEPVGRYTNDVLWGERARVLRREGYRRVILPTPEESIHYRGTRFMYGFGPEDRIALPSAEALPLMDLAQ